MRTAGRAADKARGALQDGAATGDETRPLILHVIHHFVTGGMENGLVSLINHLPASKFRHAIVCIEDYSDFRLRLKRGDTEIVALHRSRIGPWRMRYELFRTIRRLRPAIVHSRNQSGLDALLPARLAGVRHCVHSEHGWDVNDLHGHNRKQILLRWLHSPLVERYMTVSRTLKDYLVERVRVRSNRVTTICNGVDTDKFRPAAAKPAGLLPEGFASGHELIVGTVGRLQPVKDQRTLLHAFGKLIEERPGARARARLIVVGDGPLAEPLRALAQTLGIADVTWFAGNRGDVGALLQSMDVFVLPSLAEGISNTVLEAMATGVPVLATRVGGNLELVKEGVNGRLFEVGDAAMLSALLAACLDDSAACRMQGVRARDMAVREFSLQAMVDHYCAAYESLMKT